MNQRRALSSRRGALLVNYLLPWFVFVVCVLCEQSTEAFLSLRYSNRTYNGSTFVQKIPSFGNNGVFNRGRGDGNSGNNNGGGNKNYFGDSGHFRGDPHVLLLGAFPLFFREQLKRDIQQKIVASISRSSSSRLLGSFQYTASSAYLKAAEYTTWYMASIEQNPLLVKSLSSGTISLCADYLAQFIEQRQLSQRGGRLGDKRRSCACFVEGFLIAGPLMHFGYNVFESILPIQNGSNAERSLAAALHAIADIVFLDTVFVATKMLSTGLLEGHSFENDIVPQFNNDYWSTVRASWVTSTGLFPLEFACFRFVPISLRSFSMSMTSIVWDCVVSLKSHEARLR
jgi:hypothetical protein